MRRCGSGRAAGLRQSDVSLKSLSPSPRRRRDKCALGEHGPEEEDWGLGARSWSPRTRDKLYPGSSYCATQTLGGQGTQDKCFWMVRGRQP